ncbi:unnamed protein product [Rotaria sp. Silwood1]|nr:unnamed protein product [Rotaria sp. Silwood1]
MYENDVQHIDSLSKCFEQRYNNYLMFFMGSLKDACQAAFGSTCRPLLVYIYHNDNQFRKKFCETIFYSSTIIDYLNVNFVVGPYEITSESNRYTLTKIWEEIFSTQFFDNFSIEQCPLLIGVMRLFEHKIDGIVTSEYQFKSLIIGNSLTRTQMTVNRENLLNELDIFKEEYDKNEQDLSFSFVKKTGLCWEIIFEISQYLSLNDAISAFSIDILSLLNNFQSKFQLPNPYDPFIKMIFRKIKSEQIVSLEFNTSQLWLETELAFLSNINKVISITLHNSPYSDQINEYIKCFPNLTRLSLYYDDKVNYFIFNEVLIQARQQIRRFEIHCPEIFCTDDDDIDQLKKRQMSCEDELVANGGILHTKYDKHEGIMFSKVSNRFTEMSPIDIDNPNKADETNCEYWLCHTHYAHCDDRIWNCPNGTDELSCSYILYSYQCNNNEHHYLLINNTMEDCSINKNDKFNCVTPIQGCLPVERSGDKRGVRGV